jgi:hypothetical protein
MKIITDYLLLSSVVYCKAKQATDKSMTYAHCTLDTEG